MNALTLTTPDGVISGPSSPQSRKRRASAITVRFQTRTQEADPSSIRLIGPERELTLDSPAAEILPFPETNGTLLVAQDTNDAHFPIKKAALLSGVQVLQANNKQEALQLLLDKDVHVDVLLVIPHPSGSSTAAALIRHSLKIHPRLHVVMMVESGRIEDIRAGYDAGAVSIILRTSSVERLTPFLRQCFSAVYETQRQELRRRERKERRASASLVIRGFRRIRCWVGASRGSRRCAGRTAVITGVAALLVGIGLAVALERSFRASDQVDLMTTRVLEGMNRFRGMSSNQEAAILRGQASEQIGLAREANETTRRYYQDHLQELRWQKSSNRIAPEPVASPPSEHVVNIQNIYPTQSQSTLPWGSR